MIDPRSVEQLRPFLLSGERLLWTGRPRGGFVLRASDLYLIPFSLLWFGFVIFWNVEVWSTGAPILFALWGIPFLLAGFYLAVGRFAHDNWLRSKLIYAVSDRRVLILRTGLGGGLRSFEIGHLPMLALDEKANGYGTIQFDSMDQRNPWMGRYQGFAPNISRAPSFEGIEQPRIVYDLIRRETDRVRAQAGAYNSFIG